MQDLEAAIAENRAAVDRFAAAAKAVRTPRWTEKPAPGKWSPGQVAEHIAISYELAWAVLEGKSSLPAIPRFLRPLIRGLFLPKILKTGTFPKEAKAPKQFQPSDSPAPREAVVVRILAGVERLEAGARSLDRRGESHLDHPLFGKLPLLDYVRLVAIHTAHHVLQM